MSITHGAAYSRRASAHVGLPRILALGPARNLAALADKCTREPMALPSGAAANGIRTDPAAARPWRALAAQTPPWLATARQLGPTGPHRRGSSGGGRGDLSRQLAAWRNPTSRGWPGVGLLPPGGMAAGPAKEGESGRPAAWQRSPRSPSHRGRRPWSRNGPALATSGPALSDVALGRAVLRPPRRPRHSQSVVLRGALPAPLTAEPQEARGTADELVPLARGASGLSCSRSTRHGRPWRLATPLQLDTPTPAHPPPG
jgi:hypothetical protein